MELATETRPLLTIDEARAIAGNRPGRSLAYDEVRRQGTFLGVRVVRAGRLVLVPRSALERVLDGDNGGRDVAV